MKAIKNKDKLTFISECKKDDKAIESFSLALLDTEQHFQIINEPLLMMGENGTSIYSGTFEKRLILDFKIITTYGDLKYTKYPEPPQARILREDGKDIKPPQDKTA
jgi:hypothetical protein